MCSHEDEQYLSISLGHMLNRAAHLCRERMSARICPTEITPSQFHVLLCLRQNGGEMPQNQVTRYLRVRPPTVNGILNRMEEKGLIRRSISGHDARKRLINLTELGVERYDQLVQSFSDAEKVMTQGISPEEIQTLVALLNRVIQNLEEDRNYAETTVASRKTIHQMDCRRRDLQRSGGDL